MFSKLFSLLNRIADAMCIGATINQMSLLFVYLKTCAIKAIIPTTIEPSEAQNLDPPFAPTITHKPTIRTKTKYIEKPRPPQQAHSDCIVYDESAYYLLMPRKHRSPALSESSDTSSVDTILISDGEISYEIDEETIINEIVEKAVPKEADDVNRLGPWPQISTEILLNGIPIDCDISDICNPLDISRQQECLKRILVKFVDLSTQQLDIAEEPSEILKEFSIASIMDETSRDALQHIQLETNSLLDNINSYIFMMQLNQLHIPATKKQAYLNLRNLLKALSTTARLLQAAISISFTDTNLQNSMQQHRNTDHVTIDTNAYDDIYAKKLWKQIALKEFVSLAEQIHSSQIEPDPKIKNLLCDVLQYESRR